jgi:LAO/AO transport system kinase
MWQEIRETLVERFRGHPAVRTALAEQEAAVVAGQRTPGAAAEALLAAFLGEGARPAD